MGFDFGFPLLWGFLGEFPNHVPGNQWINPKVCGLVRILVISNNFLPPDAYATAVCATADSAIRADWSAAIDTTAAESAAARVACGIAEHQAMMRAG
jgi:hypothetical protein